MRTVAHGDEGTQWDMGTEGSGDMETEGHGFGGSGAWG